MLDDFFSSFRSGEFIASFQEFLDNSASIIPVSFKNIFFLAGALALALLVFGFVFRILLGTRCTPNRVVSGTIEVLFLYIFTVIIYTFNPMSFSQYLSPLPFAIFRRDILIITSPGADSFSLLASQFLSILILCFIVHLLYFLLPKGKGLLGWLFLRVLSLALAIFLNLTVNWALNTFLPDFIAQYAPTAVILLLALSLVIGLFNPLLCVVFTVVNPIFGLLYTFFFSNAFGKQLTKATFSAALVCLIFYIANYFGFSVINITSQALVSYIPVFLILLGVWFIYDKKF